MTKRTFEGSCHCGLVRFQVDLALDHVRSCDCSVCRKRGALIHRVEREDLRLLTPIEELTVYRWHTRTAEDYFCLEGIDVDSVPVRRIYGSRLP